MLSPLRANTQIPRCARDDNRVFGPIRSCSVNRLTWFGLFAVTAMLVFYAFEDRSRWFILAFAGACLLGSVYGFLQGAWPFGVVEAIWSVVAVRRWWVATNSRWRVAWAGFQRRAAVETSSYSSGRR